MPDTSPLAENSSSGLDELSDEQLMARVRKHDQEAFTCLLGRHMNAVHGYLYRLTGSGADADDLCQDTFLRLWQKASTFKPGRVKLTTWLHRIAHNLFVDELRKRRRTVEMDPPDLPDERADQLASHAGRQSLALLRTALLGLPEAQRSALVLCQIQGFSNSEAAEVLGVSVAALESLLARARRRLKQDLSEQIQ